MKKSGCGQRPAKKMKEMTGVRNRLESLDALRGFDLFCLVALESVMHALNGAADAEWLRPLMWCFTHVEWEGLSTWDLVMPLFLFMSGVSIPFALGRYRGASARRAVYWRIVKRVLLLWVFGMICQGNLLGLDPDRLYLYSNTLQAIAVGYLAAALLFLHTRLLTQAGVAVMLLLMYWGAMSWIQVDGYGGGNYTPDGNLAEWVDRTVLGRWRDGATVEQGRVVFAGWYHYTWVLSSLNFIVTVLTGLFAGQILKHDRLTPARKIGWLLLAGLGMMLAGWAWSFDQPVIKRLWTSSMTLISSGCCMALMALFYGLIDYKHWWRPGTWLQVYGMNSIAAYMLAVCVSFRSIGESVFYGLQPYLGSYYGVWMEICNAAVIYLILRELYRRQIFLRV